ncbi:hypothetical protein Tco_0115958 [Tanacetum coccineum]
MGRQVSEGFGYCTNTFSRCQSMPFCVDTDSHKHFWMTQFLGDQASQLIVKEANCSCIVIRRAEYVALSASCAQVVCRTEYQLADMFTKAPFREEWFSVSRPDALGRMPTKIELTLEQSQQGVSNDVPYIKIGEFESIIPAEDVDSLRHCSCSKLQRHSISIKIQES